MASTSHRFPHLRLDAYHLALDLFGRVERAAEGFPRGHAELKDQIRRSAAATVRHLSEGANRIQPRDKAARFALARAECGECAASLAMASVVRVIGHDDFAALTDLCDRVCAMAYGLVRREQRRLESS